MPKNSSLRCASQPASQSASRFRHDVVHPLGRWQRRRRRRQRRGAAVVKKSKGLHDTPLRKNPTENLTVAMLPIH